MVPFQEQHPNYLAYASDFEVKSFPKDALDGLYGLVYRDCLDLKEIVNFIRSYIPEGPTENWGDSWLQGDLRDAIYKLARGSLHKMMNSIGGLAERFRNKQFLADLNELLAEHNFGYVLALQHGESQWSVRESVEVVTESVDDAIAELPDAFEQALIHLEQAKEHLMNRDNDRSRKDALRDAMSAMESVYKQASGAKDITEAWKALRDAGVWGHSEIVKDGYVIWCRLHDLYPDIRHGQTQASDLSEVEGLYWIGRISAFMKYIARLHQRMS